MSIRIFRRPNRTGTSEVAEIAHRLGAPDVPTSREQVAAYFEAVRPRLRYDHRTREVAVALLSEPAPSRGAAPAMRMVFDAAKDLLPAWAAQMHGFQLSPPRRAVARTGVRAIGKTVRWALTNSAEARARRQAARLQQEPSVL